MKIYCKYLIKYQIKQQIILPIALMFYLIKKKKTEKSLDLHTILKAYDKENTGMLIQ